LVYVVTCAVMVGLIAQNWYLKNTLYAVARGRRAAVAAPEPFSVGDSALRVTLVNSSGQQVDTKSVIGERTMVLYFFKSSCDACRRQLADWRDFTELYGAQDVAFVSVQRGLADSPAGSLPRSARIFSVVGDRKVLNSVRQVPQIVVVNRCGIVTATPRVVSEVAALLGYSTRLER